MPGPLYGKVKQEWCRCVYTGMEGHITEGEMPKWKAEWKCYANFIKKQEQDYIYLLRKMSGETYQLVTAITTDTGPVHWGVALEYGKLPLLLYCLQCLQRTCISFFFFWIPKTVLF